MKQFPAELVRQLLAMKPMGEYARNAALDTLPFGSKANLAAYDFAVWTPFGFRFTDQGEQMLLDIQPKENYVTE